MSRRAQQPEMPPRETQLSLPPALFERLRDAVESFAGVYLDRTQQRVMEGAVAHRLTATGADLDRYARHVCAPEGRDELRRLAELLLNHETSFFRNRPQLMALSEVILPELHRRKPAGAPIRIWSAGCSTGEEAYTLAIAALEALGRADRPVEIIGTDLSEAALEKARAGVYRGRSLANVGPELLARHFRPRADGYAVAEAARSPVRFAPLNLLEPFPPLVRGCDLIFCQNVTIYFRAAARRHLIERFYACLPDDGLLFLGFSETLWNVFDGFRMREVAGSYVYAKQPYDPRVPPGGERPAHPLGVRRPGPNAAGDGSAGRPLRLQAAKRRPRASAAAARARGPAQAPPTADVAAAAELANAARALADRGDLDAAAAAVTRALDLDALNAEASALAGVIHARRGEWQAALVALERARYLQPAAPLISFHLADTYRHVGRADLAAREYRGALYKLAAYPADALIDGVAVGWLRETCERQLEQLQPL